MKRKFALLLAAIMASSVFTMTVSAASFKDIDDVPWSGAKEVINNAVGRGLLSGYEDNTFRARNGVTYSEAMQMAYNVLQQTGTAQSVSQATLDNYAVFLDAYSIPQWARTAVSYGLATEILTPTDVAKFMTNGRNNAATREDVAIIFGRAIAPQLGLQPSTTDVVKFKDVYKINASALEWVDLLMKANVITGDDQNNFNPQNNINRAEMAVMMNKTYDSLEESKTENIGYITKFELTDAGGYNMVVTLDNNERLSFYVSVDKVPVYRGDTTSEMSVARLTVGNRVKVGYESGLLTFIRVYDEASIQGKYDVSGYIISMEADSITLENENTGETETLEIHSSGAVYYIDGVRVVKGTFISALKENTDLYAYAGINTESKSVRLSGDTFHTDVAYITEVYVEFQEEYSQIGTLTDISSTSVGYRLIGSNSKKDISLASGCELYIMDKKSTISEMEDYADLGTTYVKVMINAQGRASGVTLSHDRFGSTASTTTKITYTVSAFNGSRIILKSGATTTEFAFGSTNPLANIKFYTWDSTNEEWDTATQSKAESYYESIDDKDTDVYCQIEVNSGGRITAIYLSDKRNAWSISDEGNLTTRRGTVESLSGETVRLRSNSTSFTLLNQYNVRVSDTGSVSTVTGKDPNGSGNSVRNPLEIISANVSSLTVFKRMAADKDVSLYAEMRVNGNNVIQSIEARVLEMSGKLVEFERGNKIVIQTDSGNKYTMELLATPTLVSDEDYSLSDLETSILRDAHIELTFDNEGRLKTIEVTETGKGLSRIRGIAKQSGNGFTVDGGSSVYTWSSSTNTIIFNSSMNSTSIYTTQDLIADSDVDVHVSFTTTSSGKVESMTVTIRGASGKFKEYNETRGVIIIQTDDGNTFGFYAAEKFSVSLSGVTEKTLNANAVDRDVTLVFNSSGMVDNIK